MHQPHTHPPEKDDRLLESKILQPIVGKEYLMETFLCPDDRSVCSQRSPSPAPPVTDGETGAPNGSLKRAASWLLTWELTQSVEDSPGICLGHTDFPTCRPIHLEFSAYLSFFSQLWDNL